MWIPRIIEARLLNSVATRPAIVLTGARQTGKTSTLRRLFGNYNFVSLDLPTEAELAEKEPQNFFNRHPLPLIVDEVQYAPNIFRHLKSIIDENRNEYGRILLTGSQKFNLMKGVSESLAGRCDVITLETLSLAEIQSTLPKLDLLTVILRGGFPELYANLEIDVVSFYNSYLATYLERDVRALTMVGSLRDFERFVRACALRSGNLLNKAELARDIGIAPSTANQWLSVLEASGQVILLEPWFSNKSKSLVKSPKIYFADSGLLCSLLNIRNQTELINYPAIGAIWETFVFAQLRQREQMAGRKNSLFFYRDRVREVDFVISAAGELSLFDAKWTELPDNRDAANLIYTKNILSDEQVIGGGIICRTPVGVLLIDNFRAISINEIFN